MVNRLTILRRLKNGGPDSELEQLCLMSNDAELQRALIGHESTSSQVLKSLAEEGRNRGARNLAKVELKRRNRNKDLK